MSVKDVITMTMITMATFFPHRYVYNPKFSGIAGMRSHLLVFVFAILKANAVSCSVSLHDTFQN